MLLPSAPPLVIGLAGVPGVRRGRHFDAHFALPMALDRRFAGATVLFAPHQGQHIADLDVWINDPEGKATTLVVAIAREHREAHGLTALDDAIERGRRIVCNR